MDGRMLGKEECENMKQVVSKFGMTVVCDEKDEERLNADVILPASEECENMKVVASKVGMQVVCDDEL